MSDAESPNVLKFKLRLNEGSNIITLLGFFGGVAANLSKTGDPRVYEVSVVKAPLGYKDEIKEKLKDYATIELIA